jgi:hypothetical protein
VLDWAGHHLVESTVALLVLVGALTALVAKRAWLYLLPAPAFLAALAWYGWEFSRETLPYAVVIAVSGSFGVAVGGLLRSRTCAPLASRVTFPHAGAGESHTAVGRVPERRAYDRVMSVVDAAAVAVAVAHSVRNCGSCTAFAATSRPR